MRVKKVLSMALAVAMAISTYTSVFAASVSNSDISTAATSDSDAAPIAAQQESPVQPIAADDNSEISGQCGDNLTWNFDESTGMLTISGSGDMWNWEFFEEDYAAPWHKYSDKIEKIEFNGSITSIGDNAFTNFTSLDSITIPSSVTSIGVSVFYGCKESLEVNIEDGNNNYSVQDGVLFNKDKTKLLDFDFLDSKVCKFEKYEIPNTVTYVEKFAFAQCLNLTEITIPNSVTFIGQWTFVDCDNLSDIYYTGSKEEWQKIDGDFREDLENVTIHYNYVPGSEPEVKVGDISGDGEIDGKDSTLIARYIAGWDIAVDKSAADINKDGKIDGKDSTLLRRYIAGWDVELG